MPSFIKKLILLPSLPLFLFISVYATKVLSQAPHSSNEPLKIGISFTIPPWVIPDSDSGIELDILKQALKPAGYDIKPVYLSFSMAYSLFEADKLDGVINAKEAALNKGFFSDTVVTFQNVAISLRQKDYPIDITPAFLTDKSVVAFQKASILLGDEFETMTKQNSMYLEVAKQNLQINLLMIRNIDFIIMDKSIFGYYWRQAQLDPNLLRSKSKLNQEIQFHKMFEPSPYRFVFRTEKVRDDFNKGLSDLRESGEYNAILQRYAHLINLYED